MSSFEQKQEENLSSIKLSLDSKGVVKPEVKVYSKSNKKKDILAAKNWAQELFNNLMKANHGS